MKKLKFFDSTLRDGSHAIKHSLSKQTIADYCAKMDNAGMDAIIVGHGNGLGASSLQTGLSTLSDADMLITAREHLRKTSLGAFLIPGYGTIRDDLAPAIDMGVDLVCVAAHCTEANVTRQHIEYVKSKNKSAFGVLMMYHMAETQVLVNEALKMQDYGADGVIIMDSAGASTPELVSKTIRSLKRSLAIDVGFHPHNNLGLAVGNAYVAYENGADIIDATVKGFGAGAGNCQLEAFIALLQKLGIETGVDLYALFDVGDQIIEPVWAGGKSINSISIVSGMSGVFSSFVPHVKAASAQFNVDEKDIFIELGNRKVVGGQEDMVVDVAMNLAQRRKNNLVEDMISSLQ
ncbi:MAG: 4-hydroxy-2-oxovalerate aldolase [Fibromonadales bacterium]|nr:4-hydroxy-2-oxovalerate aldolase [Fibromonadales bacterium]